MYRGLWSWGLDSDAGVTEVRIGNKEVAVDGSMWFPVCVMVER